MYNYVQLCVTICDYMQLYVITYNCMLYMQVAHENIIIQNNLYSI